MPLEVAVLGLGEAGAAIGSDLAAAGCLVRGWDPRPAATAAMVARAPTPADAVAGSDLVLSLTTAAHALEAAATVAPALVERQAYADLNTTSPALKREVAAAIAPTGAAFADVALLGPVPGRGAATPAIASGAGAERFAELVCPLGMPVEVVGSEPGDAAGLKLVRSVFMKGLAASAFESVQAATAQGADTWLRREIAEVIGASLLERLLSGSVTHAERRHDEMVAASAYLEELGVEPRVSRATAAWLASLVDDRRPPTRGQSPGDSPPGTVPWR